MENFYYVERTIQLLRTLKYSYTFAYWCHGPWYLKLWLYDLAEFKVKNNWQKISSWKNVLFNEKDYNNIFYWKLFYDLLHRWKGTVRVISSYPPCKDGNARFTTVPLNWSKMLKIVFLGLEVFVSDNSYVFYCSRNARVTFIENPQLKIISFQNLRGRHENWDQCRHKMSTSLRSTLII